MDFDGHFMALNTRKMSYNDLSALLQETERYAKMIYAPSSDHLLNQLLSEYCDCQRARRMREHSPQQILDGLLFTELKVLQAWNEHRLGLDVGVVYPIHDARFRAPNLPYDLPKPDRTVQAYIDRVIFDQSGNVRDVDDAFPARRTAKLMLARYAIPVPLEAKSFFERREVPQNGGTVTSLAESTSLTNAPVAAPPRLAQPSQSAATATPTKRKTPSTAEHDEHNRLADAPSLNLDFPTGNVTAVEILVFFPHWLKSWDVIDRLASNGWTTGIMTRVINRCREMPHGQVSNNTVLRMMAPSMRQRDGSCFAKWTVGSHQVPDNWDAASISVTGFRTPRITHPRKGGGAPTLNAPVPPVPFKELARGVEYWPAGYDALDLTRCIQYHISHPQEEWRFPTDFGALLDRLGRTTVRTEHSDRAAFDRWRPAKGPADLPRVCEADLQSGDITQGNTNRLEEIEPSSTASEQVERPNKRLRMEPHGGSENTPQGDGIDNNNAVLAVNPQEQFVNVGCTQQNPHDFSDLGFQYLHTIPLPPPQDVSELAENIRWGHMHPELRFTLSPADISTVTSLRLNSSFFFTEYMNAMLQDP